jgi:pimeloyl-ACP methyl ester carboxylesterase
MTHTSYAYLHGFASGPRSYKGTQVGADFAARGVTLDQLDLNVPSFGLQTYSNALTAVDLWWGAQPPDARAVLVGSSLGGYLAARWANLHPERVERLVLLCPGFHLVDRWPKLLGEVAFRAWERDGAFPLRDVDKKLVPVHWGFVQDARLHPPAPEVACPTLVIHGARDEVVPLQSSLDWVALDPARRRLVTLDDDHAMTSSAPRICDEVAAFLSLPDRHG